ncbi:DUF6519 domain-containing protein [Streptomyces sp. JHA26]|uniref:DUF6519 domain-containing protein n=1 Tax=Streptomyces sp. JHA26 TaxID=1917143 RepID=UPI00098B2821|nr:DUF6519 domain-containing protein [Streptomyces sp. JHA26]
MHGDFTRWTFTPKEAYRSVLLQQGRVVLDADWNEQAALTAHHDETRTLDLAGWAGGPLTGAGFAIVGADGAPAKAARWEDLAVTPGRYYVAGTLVEAAVPPSAAGEERAGWPLRDQPHVREVDGVPALPEPPPGRYTAFLDVWTHLVTADERPALREAALGGPDTSGRAQTVWQVRVASEEAPRTPRSMAASLGTPREELDPCAMAPTGGYLGLENQLYRVQIHHPGPDPTFLWSRENGSVVAGVTGIAPASETEPLSQLALDREGRDEELSIRKDHLVEVTSTDLQVRRQPGFLATVTSARGLQLTVRWWGPVPTLAQLGRTPLVRRWEGLLPVTEEHQDLENGIRVRFPSGGTPGSGDYWLIPARTSRLLHGQTSQAGTIEWPPGTDEQGEPMAPVGPVVHSAPLALLTRDDTGWTVERDCRRLFPAQTELVALDLAGGDGQQAPPGSPLPQPVRVAARNGGLPLPGAPVLFTVEGGGVLTGLDGGGTGRRITEETGPDGVAAVAWTLDPDGEPTQRLTVTLLERPGAEPGIPPALTVTGRLAIAAQVAWQRPAEAAAFAEPPTVQNALERLATLRELRLLGGDGQHLGPRDRVLPQPVRAVVDSACGPVRGAAVTATASGQGLVAVARPSDTEPPAPGSAPWGVTEDSETGPDGTVAFWWQPDPEVASDVLHLRRPDGPDAPLTVTAQKFLERAVADDVTWTPPGQCADSPASRTVQAALVWLAERRQLRLVSGDGQYPRVGSRILPQPVRVLVDSACGPVRGATVIARANSGALVAEATGGTPPAPGSSAWAGTGEGATGEDGTVAFWWQPVPGAAGDTVGLRLEDGDGAVVTVTLAPRPGVHITAVRWLQPGPGAEQEFRNDDTVTTATLVGGISVVLDRPIDLRSIMNSATDRRPKPVCHVALDLPAPLLNEFPWAVLPNNPTMRYVQLSTIVLPPAPFAADVSDQTIQWRPTQSNTVDASATKWLTERLPGRLRELPDPLRPITGRFVIEGSAIVAKDDPGLRLNCHAPYVLEGDRTRLLLPTDDAVPGGRFVQWFRLDAP